MRFGPARYFCPVCVRQPHGFVGGPAGYEEVSAAEKDAGPLIVEAWQSGEIPLHEARKKLDREENQKQSEGPND